MANDPSRKALIPCACRGLARAADAPAVREIVSQQRP